MSPLSVNSLPLVNIIIPTYNYAGFIAQTLESLRAQTYTHWECVVVDDGSTDDTRAVVARFVQSDARISYVYQENGRQAAARNNGLRRSGGQYVQFLDADDLLESRKLERQVAYLEAHPEVDIIYGSVRYFRTERMDERLYSMTLKNEPWMPETSGSGQTVLRKLVRHNMLAVNSALLRRRVVSEVGYFDEALPPLEDWDYFIRCAFQGKHFQYENLEGTLALVRWHLTSSSRNNERMLKQELALRTKFATLTRDAELLELNREMIVQAEGLAGVYEVAEGRCAHGFYQLLRTSARSQRMWVRLKWLACAMAAPFVPGTLLGRFATSSVGESPQLAWRKVRNLLPGARKSAINSLEEPRRF